jgi:hypothetical protein
MKRHFNKIILLAGSGLIFLAACNKNNNPVYFNGGQSPALTATAADSIPLPLSDTTATAVTFSWTNPNYAFSDGISSQDVSYNLQFDTVGGNFSSPSLATIGLTSQLSATFTVAQLNTVLTNQMLLDTSVQHSIQVRIQSFIKPLNWTQGTPLVGMLNSNTLNYTVTPYATPPAVPELPTALWITGSSTADGWMTAGQLSSIAGQQMTEVTPTLWTITMPMIAGQQFLLVPANNWNNKYATSDGNETGTGGTFAFNASNNFIGPTKAGTYTVTFNFQTGTFTIK